MVQAAITVKAPKNTRISKKVLQQLLQRAIEKKPLPKNVSIDGIFWRNPNRKGAQSHWRYHEGADLTALRPEGSGIESSPRESLQRATESLGGALYSGVVTLQKVGGN